MTRFMKIVSGLSRRTTLLIFVFLTLFYTMWMGVNRAGYGYSPDGTFAFEMAKSLATDPDHEYFHKFNKNFSRWGIGLPIALIPFVLAAEPFADSAPQRDSIFVDGHEYTVSTFPSVGPSHDANANQVQLIDVELPEMGAVSRVDMISHSGLSTHMSQGLSVARMIVTDDDGDVSKYPIRVGIETAEWAFDRADVRATVKHQSGRVVGKHIGDTRANFYFASFVLEPPANVSKLQFEHVGDRGVFFVDSLALLESQSQDLVDIGGTGRVWSERQNKEFFLRMPSPLVSVMATALTAAILYRIILLFGYERYTGLGISFIYGIATMAWPFAKFDFAEPLVSLFIMGGFWGFVKYIHVGSSRYTLLMSLALLGAVLTKYVALVTVPIFFASIVLANKYDCNSWKQCVNKSWRGLFVFLLPFVGVSLPAIVLLALILDFRFLYQDELIGGLSRGWLGVPMWLGLWGLLFSWGKGFFLYNPIMLLVVPGSFWFVLRHGWRSAPFLLIPLAYLVLYSKKEVWYGGNTWGPRYMVPTIPILMVMAAPLLEKIIKSRTNVIRFGVVILLIVSVFIQVLGMSKDFDLYLGVYADQVVNQLPDAGVEYGGAEYQQWSSKQPEGDLAAVLYSYQFSPLLAHMWLLRADLIELVAPDRLDWYEAALWKTPWSRFGVLAPPSDPGHAAGLDFWSMTLLANYFNHQVIVVATIATLVAIQIGALTVLGLLLRSEAAGHIVSRRTTFVAIIFTAAVFMSFDTLHFML